ncbi:hypothetical protein NDU88_008632 [Pleurodeles waltl]|uniref:Uncharacterized protein n=1 Tax=Pleurodeles waltl TaxID=8319 RepID=A0AAV7NZW4_PLEWA|nr:hypothetical protein NDU88_008632 [Pleurodeles waltl]
MKECRNNTTFVAAIAAAVVTANQNASNAVFHAHLADAGTFCLPVMAQAHNGKVVFLEPFRPSAADFNSCECSELRAIKLRYLAVADYGMPGGDDVNDLLK